MKDRMARGLGVYFILLLVGLLVFWWLQGKNIQIDKEYTIDNFEQDVKSGVVDAISISRIKRFRQV